MDRQSNRPSLKSLRRSSAALLIGSGLAIVLALMFFRTVTLHLDSEPTGASLWVDGAFVGVAPTKLAGLGRGRHLVVAKRHGYKAWRRTVSAVKPNHRITATLDPAEQSSLAVTTDPPGALVLLDGQPRGRTPLTLGGVPAGVHHLRLVREGFATADVVTQVGQGERAAVHRALQSRTEAYYQHRIETDPSNLHHVVELAKLRVLKHRFQEAEDTFLRAAPLLRGYGESDDAEGRLYQELDKIHEAQFEYGDYQAVRKGQAMVRRVLEGYLAHKDANAYAHYYLARACRREGQHQTAIKHLHRAQALADNSTLLRRIDREFKQVHR